MIKHEVHMPYISIYIYIYIYSIYIYIYIYILGCVLAMPYCARHIFISSHFQCSEGKVLGKLINKICMNETKHYICII